MANNIVAHAERIAKHYWGEPNKKLSKKGMLRWGNAGSKELDTQRGVYYDFEEGHGGGIVDIVRRYGRQTITGSVAETLQREFGINKQTADAMQPAKYIEKIYEYYDTDGELRYQVLRYHPKTFRQRRPDGKGGWIYNMDGVEALPFNLPEIMLNPDAPIFIVEGEKAAERLIKLGLVATTSHGGAGKWSDALARYFEGRNVVVMPDNDNAGRRHADQVVRALWGRARAIKRVELDGLPEKGDVVDWLFKGGTVQSLLEAVKATPALDSVPEELDAADDALEAEVEGDNALKPYALLDQDDVWLMPPVEFLVDELIPERSFAMIYGQPGAGKSFLAIDMALSVAHGVDWQGKKVKQGSVLYIAGEGLGGFGKRWKAWSKHKGLEQKPDMYLLPTAVNMMDEQDVSRLVMTVEELGREWALVIIDTVARAIAGADENAAQSIGMFVQSCDRVRAAAGGTMLAVHHSGKDSSRGARGSNALLGALDTSIVVGKLDDVVTIKVEKQKDAEPIDEMSFNMVAIQVGVTDTSVVLERTDAPAHSPKRKKPPSVSQARALKALQNLCAERGVRVPITEWHKAHERDCPDTHKSTRKTARDALVDGGFVVISDGVCWINNDLAEL
jgi:RecA-family ATPase/5S rRNA maturation endonuclease (ribonuclease M5)